MSAGWTRTRAACVYAIIAAAGQGSGGTPACALDAPADQKTGAVGARTAQINRKSAKPLPVKASVPAPPAKPGLPHPAGWPAAPIGGDSATHRNVPSSAGTSAEPKQNEIQRIEASSPEAPPEVEEQNFFQRMIRARTRAIETEPDDPKRRELVDPPDGYRRQTPTTPQAADKGTNKSQGLLGILGALWGNGTPPGKTDEAAGAPPAAKPGSDVNETGGLLGKIGGMIPGFLQGSDKK